MDDIRFEHCIERMVAGEKEALREIYEEYLGYIFHLILGMVGNRQDAEDITSEFFIKLWNIAPKYKTGNSHKAWLTKIARNLTIDYLRAHKKEIAYDDTEETFESMLSEHQRAEKGEQLPQEEVLSDISMSEMLKDLKPAEREIIHLKIVGDFTFQEIAEILKIPFGTVTWRYQAAIKKLRRYGYEA